MLSLSSSVLALLFLNCLVDISVMLGVVFHNPVHWNSEVVDGIIAVTPPIQMVCTKGEVLHRE